MTKRCNPAAKNIFFDIRKNFRNIAFAGFAVFQPIAKLGKMIAVRNVVNVNGADDFFFVCIVQNICEDFAFFPILRQNRTVFCVRLQLFCTLSTQEKLAQSVARYVNGVEKPVSHCGCRRACRQSRRFDFEMILSGLSIFSPYCAAVGSTGFRPNLSVTTRRSLVLILVRSKTTRGFSGTCPVSAMTFRSLI